MELEQDRFLLAKAAMSSEIENRNDDWPKTFQKKFCFVAGHLSFKQQHSVLPNRFDVHIYGWHFRKLSKELDVLACCL